jgi:hypothetical protein
MFQHAIVVIHVGPIAKTLMKMKGQITRHEWEPVIKFSLTDKCLHCESRRYRRPGRKTNYWDYQLNRLTHSEPKCITRKKTEDESVDNKRV